jgi:hypothetical protein
MQGLFPKLLCSYCSWVSVYVYVFLSYSLGEQFNPLAAYVPTGPDALAAYVYEDPVEMIMEVLKDVYRYGEPIMFQETVFDTDYFRLCHGPHVGFDFVYRNKISMNGLALISVGGFACVPCAASLLSMMATSMNAQAKTASVKATLA